MKKVGVILLSMLVVVPVLASESSGGFGGVMDETVCKLLLEFGSVFRILRTLAFVGAGFTIAGWAWGWISAGKGPDVTKDLKEKGLGLLIGFGVLFGLGVLINILLGMGDAECEQELVNMWN